MAKKKKKKLKLRIDRVIIAAVAVIVVLFGVYKGCLLYTSAPVLHAYFDVFAGCIQTLVFVTLSSILISIEAE